MGTFTISIARWREKLKTGLDALIGAVAGLILAFPPNQGQRRAYSRTRASSSLWENRVVLVFPK